MFGRMATRFQRLLVRLSPFKSEGTQQGDYAGLQMAVIQLPPNQTANALEIQDSSGGYSGQGNVLFAVDASGNIAIGGSPKAKQCCVQVALTAAQITTLHSAPVTLLAASAAGTAIIPTAMLFELTFGSAQFTGGGAVSPVYHGATTALTSSVAAATIQGASSAYVFCDAATGPTVVSAATGIDLYAASADFAAGDSTGVVTLWYTLITL